MILPDDTLEELAHLADALAASDNFTADATEFQQLAAALRRRVERYCDEPEVLELVDRLPELSPPREHRSFLAQLLPAGGRDMVENYQAKERMRAAARRTVALFREMRRWMG